MTIVSPRRLSAFALLFALTACGNALEYSAPSSSAPLDEVPPAATGAGSVTAPDASGSTPDAASDASVPDATAPADGGGPKMCPVRPAVAPPGPRLISRQVTGSGACATTTLGQTIDAAFALVPSVPKFTLLFDPQNPPFWDGPRIHAFKTTSGGFAIILEHRFGDCPAGCPYRDFFYFETDAACTPKQLGELRSLYRYQSGSSCQEIVGAPMWGTPANLPFVPLCNADNAARDVSGTYSLCTKGHAHACTLPASPQTPFDANLTLVVAQTADLSKGTVTITGTGNPLVDGVALDATVDRRRVRAKKSVTNLPGKCFAEHTIDLDLDFDDETVPGSLIVDEVRSDPACTWGGAGPFPYCKASSSIQLYPPVTPATTAVCIPGVHQCIGNVSQTCDATGHWTTGTTCSLACIEGVCTTCVPGAKDCAGKVPRTCGSNGQWYTLPECTHACGGAGVCGAACTGDCTCVGGVCPPAVLATSATSYAVDAESVYWTTTSLQKAPLAGGPPVVLAPLEVSGRHIVLDSTHVYYADAWAGQVSKVKSVPIGGGAPWTLATTVTGGPSCMFVDGTGVYWTSSAGLTKSTFDGALPTTFSPTTSTGIALPAIGQFAMDATHIYWGSSKPGTNGVIYKMPREGGTPVAIVSNETSTQIVVDGARVYWLDGHEYRVRAAPLGGGPVETLARTRYVAQSIAVDATDIYWAENPLEGPSDSSVMTVPLTGGTPTVLASKLPQPTRITVSGGSVYWLSGGSVMSVPK